MPVRSESHLVSNTLWARRGKRIFDLLLATVLMMLTSPILILAALLVKLTSQGPLLFVQERTGRNGVPFRTVKLRTMRGDRTPDPKEIVPLDHPEITSIGKTLRRLKIDELPQLFQVVIGRMALVGPRPTLPDQTREYDAFRRQRLSVRPGITGLAQVNGNVTIPWDERILYDIAYVRQCSLWLDLAILLRTLLVIAQGERRSTSRFIDSPYAKFVKIPTDYYSRSPGDE